MFSDKLIKYYNQLKPPANLPKGIEVLFPQKDKQVIEIAARFFNKYFNDDHPRRLLLGINPGRYGAGITGVNFTAPKQLKEHCKIDHHFKISSELSAEFIYDMIGDYGGVNKFYREWFIGSVCPLGFTASPELCSFRSLRSGTSKGGVKNMNYYDDKKLLKAVTPFIVDCISKLASMGFMTDKLPHGKFWMYMQIFFSGPALAILGLVLYFKYGGIVNRILGMLFFIIAIYWLYNIISDVIKEAA